MEEKEELYVLRRRAVPKVLLKVVEAERLLQTKKACSVQQAADMVGISRSSFYKYREDIFPFRDNSKGKVITLLAQIDDEPGLLSLLLRIAFEQKANILTINQSLPVNGTASVTLGLEIREDTSDPTEIVEQIANTDGVHSVTILAHE